MAVVTGTLRDFGMANLAAFQPQIVFTPTGPAMHGDTVLATKPVVVIPAADGTFTATLFLTTYLQPAQTYRMSVRWQDSAGNYPSRDEFTWDLRVPAEGGAISTLLAAKQNPTNVWVGLTPPLNPSKGSWWLESSDDGLSGTGNLYEWSA
jgi:hypothetical protein